MDVRCHEAADHVRTLFGTPVRIGVAILVAGTVFLTTSAPSSAQPTRTGLSQATGASFDDSASDRMVLSNNYYQLTLSKTNGAILSILDRSTAAYVSQGSNGGCLWGASFSDGAVPYVGGCSFGSTGNAFFSYQWDGLSTLSLSYSGSFDADRQFAATVTVVAGSSAAFELQITIQNSWGALVHNVLLPSELLFPTDAVQAGYVPYYLPGVRLLPGFFSGYHDQVPFYPGNQAFADFIALDSAGGHLAIYTVNPYALNGPSNPIAPVALGFIHAGSSGCGAASFCSYHSFLTHVPSGGSWISPTVRVLVGQPIDQALQAYRTDNGISVYPSLADKLGPQLESYARAPLIKADAWAVNQPFRSWIPDLSRLPSPALLHPVGYMPGGHDHGYPDFLPPDARWGTQQTPGSSQADFLAMVRAARRFHLLVMPYTNPTWWTVDSYTMKHMAPHGVAEISVIQNDGQPLYQFYATSSGYVVSPADAFVQDRLASTMIDWQSRVPVDCVFEDQVGARPWTLDLNPAEPSALAYSDGWLQHTADYANRCLMTEDGWDRLAATEVGFHGSLLTAERDSGVPDKQFGAGNWQPYPMALWLFHDKVLLYQHDLSPRTMSQDSAVLMWNLAFGTMLSYEWDSTENSLSSPWLSLIAWLQRDVASRYAGQRMTGYATLRAGATQTDFGGLHIVANWSPTASLSLRGQVIAPNGFMAWSDDNSILAGEFSGSFNGAALLPGSHYVLVERSKTALVVRQPVGSDTLLANPAPAGWSASQVPRAVAFDANGVPIAGVPAWRSGKQLLFRYAHQVRGKAVAWYRVTGVRRDRISPTLGVSARSPVTHGPSPH